MTIDIVMTRSVPAEAGTTTTIIRTKEPSEEPSLVGLGVILGIASSTDSVECHYRWMHITSKTEPGTYAM